jgi:hypothetical protein
MQTFTDSSSCSETSGLPFGNGTGVALTNYNLTETESEGQAFTTKRNHSPNDSRGPPPPRGPGPVTRFPDLHPSGAVQDATRPTRFPLPPSSPQQIP